MTPSRAPASQYLLGLITAALSKQEIIDGGISIEQDDERFVTGIVVRTPSDGKFLRIAIEDVEPT